MQASPSQEDGSDAAAWGAAAAAAEQPEAGLAPQWGWDAPAPLQSRECLAARIIVARLCGSSRSYGALDLSAVSFCHGFGPRKTGIQAIVIQLETRLPTPKWPKRLPTKHSKSHYRGPCQ